MAAVGGRTGSWTRADEGAHGDLVDEWTFTFWTADGAAGGIVLLRLWPAARRCWYWAALARAGRPVLHVSDWDAPWPRVGLTVRADGLWADHICEAPFEQWTVANETYAVALDDPDEARGRAYGTAAAVAMDLEWYATTAPTPIADGYEQAGEVDGTVELEEGALEVVAAGAHRSHRWAGALDLPRFEPVVAHLGLRALAHFPDQTELDLVLTPDGWRSRVPRSADG